MSKVIVSLIGHGGSGKSSAANHLKEKYGFAVFTFSSVIREYAAANGIDLKKRSDFAHAHAEILKEHGSEYMVSLALSLPAERICIDDVRSPRYAENIRAAGGKEIAFDCPVEVRFAHVRNHPDKAKYPDTLEKFIQNEQEDESVTIGAGLEFETSALMQAAECHIDASKTLEDTFHQLDEIVEPLLNS